MLVLRKWSLLFKQEIVEKLILFIKISLNKHKY